MASSAVVRGLRAAGGSANPPVLRAEITRGANLTRLEEERRSPVTMSAYRYNVTKLGKFIGGLRVGEATAARVDAAIRSMNNAHGPTMARQCKTIATLIEDEGLSARIGADQLGHSNVSMTQDRYMKRGGVHQQGADLMDRAVDINDE